MREEAIDEWQLEEFSKRTNNDFFSLREELETLPATTFQDVQKAAGQVMKVLPDLVGDKLYKSLYDRNLIQLGKVVRVLPELDTLTTIDESVSLSGEILGILFDFQKIAIVLHDNSGQGFSMTGTWGLPEYLGKFPETKMAELTSPESVKKPIKLDEEFKKFFPQIEAEFAIFFPFKKEDELLGSLVLFDCKPHWSDFPLIELITDRIAIKIMQLKKESEQLQTIQQSNRMFFLQNSFFCVKDRDDLYRNILENASNLVKASRGSLMILNENKKSLFIQILHGDETSDCTVGVGKTG